MAAGRGEVFQGAAEVHPARLAAVLGVNNVQVSGAVAAQAAEVVKDAPAEGVAVAATAAKRAGPTAVVARARLDQGVGQILDTGDPLGTVRQVLSGRHGSLPSALVSAWKAQQNSDDLSRASRLPCYSLELCIPFRISLVQ
jgi:hypothetical protein